MKKVRFFQQQIVFKGLELFYFVKTMKSSNPASSELDSSFLAMLIIQVKIFNKDGEFISEFATREATLRFDIEINKEGDIFISDSLGVVQYSRCGEVQSYAPDLRGPASTYFTPLNIIFSVSQ